MLIDTRWNKEFAKVREGEKRLSNGNHKLYKCPADKMTIGWGYNIEEHGIDDGIANMLLNSSLMSAQKECAKNVKGWDRCNAPRKSVLIDMCFNIGWTRLSGFKKMLAAIDKEDWKKAAAEMKDSKWFKQVGDRSKALHEIMLKGEYPE